MKEFGTRSCNKISSQKELCCPMINASYTSIKAWLPVPPVIAVLASSTKILDSKATSNTIT